MSHDVLFAFVGVLQGRCSFRVGPLLHLSGSLALPQSMPGWVVASSPFLSLCMAYSVLVQSVGIWVSRLEAC